MPEKVSAKTKNIICLLLLLTGFVFIVIGIDRGEAAMVLRKAIKICLECIGIG